VMWYILYRYMHIIQEKILSLLSENNNSFNLTLREIGNRINEPDQPQKIKHHLSQLTQKGLVKIDKKTKAVIKVQSGKKEGSNIISLPILGSANCGEATCFADNYVEGYLQVTKGILGNMAEKINELFVLRAVGNSMNRSKTKGGAIEDGDYVVIHKTNKLPKSGQYVVSVIDDVANIKKLYIDSQKKQIVLISESNQSLPPIYIHKNDLGTHLISGVVVMVLKTPDELSDFINASASDISKNLDPLSKDEHDYYMNL